MRSSFSTLAIGTWLAGGGLVWGGITPEQARQLPPPAQHTVEFAKEIKPIFDVSCIKCHGRGRDQGGFKLDTRETLLAGGDGGPAIVPGKSTESHLIELVQGFDPDSIMPKKGTKLTPEQIGLLRAWIDQGAKWESGVSFGRVEPRNLKPIRPAVPAGPAEANPIDRFLQPYYQANHVTAGALVNDRVFARRVYLDVIGLLPAPEALEAFVADQKPDKRVRLVRSLLADNRNYAQHWITFWNDALRNDYRGTGYIDGGRKQITGWLYSALATNLPYNQFVARLVNPTPDSEGFAKGIVWRGVVNASQTPQMQAAQNISQVFMGVNLKCASCHDSFVNDLTLADAYGLAGIYAEGALEMVHCDKPTGKKADLKFLYPELGVIDPGADKATRLKRLAEVITRREDARLTTTIVNRLWQRFLGRGLVEPVDEMDKPAWDPDLLAWLAEDLADHEFNLKHTIERMLTSRAYQMAAVSWDEKSNSEYVFRGPLVRRMSAEQFCDAISELTGVWPESSAAQIDYTAGLTNKPAAAVFPAKWVWSHAGADASSKPGAVYFRKSIHLDSVPTRALMLLAADNSYTLFVNGKKAGSGNDFKHFEVIDIRPQLVAGDNVIAVHAVNGGEGPNPAGLFAFGCLRQERKDQPAQVLDFGTDSSWLQSEKKTAGWEKTTFAATDWLAAAELGGIAMAPWNDGEGFASALGASENLGQIRASLVNADNLMVALGRPNREQVVTTRASAATTLQALELTNGRELSERIKQGAARLVAEKPADPGLLASQIYEVALGRKPNSTELKLAGEMLGQPAAAEGVEDLLWAMTMLPEFQLIY